MSDFKSIADVPEMLELWDFDKNPEDPKTVSSISRLPYYWKCKLCGYEWSTTPHTRSRTKGKCPSCDSNKSVQPGVNDVFTLVPGLKKIYDFEKTKVLTLSIRDGHQENLSPVNALIAVANGQLS